MKNIIKKSIFVLTLVGILGVGASSVLAVAFSIDSASVTGVTSTTATLRGTVNPNGGLPISAWFQDDQANTLPGSQMDSISGPSAVSVMPYSLTGLTPNTNYTFFLYATDGPDMLSNSITFTTDPLPSPSIVSASVSDKTTTTVTLNGTVNPNGTTANAWFQDQNGMTLSGSEVNGLTGNSSIPLPPYSLTGLTPSTSYTYTLYADDGINIVSQNISFTTNSTSGGGGGGGGSSGGGSSTTHSPSATTQSATSVTLSSAVLNAAIDPNGYSTTAWFEYGTSSSLSNSDETSHISKGSSSSSQSLSQTISGLTANKTYYFRAVANNTYGTNKGSIFSFKTGEATTPVVSTPVVTVQATSKTASSARFNGIFLNKDGISAKGYFEYGKTPSMTSSTAKLDLGVKPSVSFADSVINLTPNTIYYFRAVVVQSGVTYNGKILVFQTLKAPVVPVVNNNSTTPKPTPVVEPVIEPATVSDATQSSVLQVTTDAKDVATGDEINYLVTFKNNTAKNFENTTISVQLPKEVDFKESNFGKQGDDNTVVFDAGILIPDQVGSITIKGKINSNATPKDIMITTAILSYNNSDSTVRNDEIAYVANNILEGSGGLTANSIFGVSLIPTTLIGWLALIIAILVLVAISRKIYMNYALKRSVNAHNIDNLPM